MERTQKDWKSTFMSVNVDEATDTQQKFVLNTISQFREKNIATEDGEDFGKFWFCTYSSETGNGFVLAANCVVFLTFRRAAPSLFSAI